MRGAGLTIEVLLEYFKLLEQGDQTIEARKQILEEQRVQLLTKIAEMQETLALLEYKINFYENALVEKESEMEGIQK
jgi:DNA-binding transcriptional MerR regulator